jgi:endonuclease-3 related protein
LTYKITIEDMENKELSRKLTGIYNALLRRFGPQHWWPGDTPLEIMIGAILTQNTNWANVEKAIGNLKAEKALDARLLCKMDPARLAALIRPSGYFNVKARRLQALMKFLYEEYGGDPAAMADGSLENLRQKLLAVHGVGAETADSILLYALNMPVFVTDAYTRRIFSRLGMIPEKSSYDDTQRLFKDHLRKEEGLFNEYHALLVALGKNYCRPRPLCQECPLITICPEGNRL